MKVRFLVIFFYLSGQNDLYYNSFLVYENDDTCKKTKTAAQRQKAFRDKMSIEEKKIYNERESKRRSEARKLAKENYSLTLTENKDTLIEGIYTCQIVKIKNLPIFSLKDHQVSYDQISLNSISPAQNVFRPGYFETQILEYCAVHALNNVLQNNVFSVELMNRISIGLSKIEPNQNFFNPNSGDYSTEVIDQALQENGFNFVLRENFDRDSFQSDVNSGQPFMCIITQDTHHYSARRFQISGQIWIFDSKLPFPVMDSAILENQLLFNILKHFDQGHIQRAPQVLILLESGRAACLVVPNFIIYKCPKIIDFALPFIADAQMTVLHRPNQCGSAGKCADKISSRIFKFKKPLNNSVESNVILTSSTPLQNSKISSISVTKLTPEQIREKNNLSHLKKYELDKLKTVFYQPSFFHNFKNNISSVNCLNNIFQCEKFCYNDLSALSRDVSDLNQTKDFAIDIILILLKNTNINYIRPCVQVFKNKILSKNVFFAFFSYKGAFYSLIRFKTDDFVWLFDSSLDYPVLDGNLKHNSVLAAILDSTFNLNNTVFLDILDSQLKFKEVSQPPVVIGQTNSPLKSLIRGYQTVYNTSQRALARLSEKKRLLDVSVIYKSKEKIKQNKKISNDKNILFIPCFFEKQSTQGEYCGVNAINNLFQFNMVQSNTLINFGIGKSKLAAHRGVELFRYKNPRGKFHSSLLLMFIEEVLKCKTLTLHRKSHYDDKLNSKEPIMLLITQYDHHYSARRFEKDGELWVFDSLHPYGRGIKDADNLLITNLSYQMEYNLEKPIVLQVDITHETPLRQFDSFYVDFDCSKEIKKPKEFVFKFQLDVPLCSSSILPPSPLSHLNTSDTVFIDSSENNIINDSFNIFSQEGHDYFAPTTNDFTV
jgi:hypothetical protein